MTITSTLSQAINRASARTAGLLWRPFDAGTWVVLAFAQFLAALPPDFWGGGGGMGNGGGNWNRAGERIESFWDWLVAGGAIIALIAVGLVVLLAVILALVWVSSRAKFVFLDDVIHGRARIVEPWNRFGREGNSLFLCTVALFLAACAFIAVVVAVMVSIVGIGALRNGEVSFVALGIAACLAAFIAVVFGYLAFCLNAFVVPLMHRYRIGALAAWRRFFGIFGAHPFSFLAVGLVVMVGFFVFAVAAISFGFMTCCIGFLLLIAPYLSNLLLLPATVFYRAFTVEFLAQFDGELLAVTPARGPLP